MDRRLRNREGGVGLYVNRYAHAVKIATSYGSGTQGSWAMQAKSSFGLSLLAMTCLVTIASAPDRGPDGRARKPGLSGWCETPVASRKAEPGCYTTAITELGALPSGALYWHLDTFPDRASAEANRGPRGTVVD